ADGFMRVGGHVAGERAVVTGRVAQHDLLQPGKVEVAAVHLDQRRRAVAREEVLEVVVLPGARERESVVVEGERPLIVPRPDRLPGGLAQKLEMLAAFAHEKRTDRVDSRDSPRELKAFLPARRRRAGILPPVVAAAS